MSDSEQYELAGFAIPEGLDELRLMLQAISADHPEIDPMAFMLFETAVTEIANNVIEHGSPPGKVRWRFHIEIAEGRLVARLTDSGDAFTGTIQAEMPDEMAEGGRGLALAHAILDDLRYERAAGTNVWHMERAIRE